MQITPEGVKVDRELSDLDKFAVDFCKVIGKHTNYVIVSGYVSILLGRTRGSEDVDFLIPAMDENSWKKIYRSLQEQGYECINASEDDSFSYLNDGTAVRFAPEWKPVPNAEILLATSPVQKLAFSTRIPARVGNDTIFISNLELQIAYKEKVLGSPKDMEDARHLRRLLGKAINLEKLKEYEGMLDEQGQEP